MPRPQFPKRATQPMRPRDYLRAAHEVRALADKIATRSEATTSQDKRILTMAIQSLYHTVKRLRARHLGLAIRDESALVTAIEIAREQTTLT